MSAVIQNEYTGNNSTTTYSFTFPYLKTSDIKVSLDGVATTAFTLPNATTIQFNTAPPQDAKIKIFRETSVDDLTATFYAGSAIKSEDLNDNFTQNLYKTQEVGARSLNTLGGTMTGNLTLDTQADLVFEGATADAHETTIKVVDPTADRTITFPNVTGTVVTTGDTGTVATGMIANDAINGTKIADDSINSEHYVDGSIDTQHIADAQVTTAKLANNAVTNAKITNATINANDKLVDGTISAAKLQADSVTTAKIADNAITNAKIADNSIDSEHYVDGSIDAAHIASNAITNVKMADDSVGTAELQDSSVDTARLADNSVTLAKMTDNSVGTSELVDVAVTTAKLASNAVTTAKITDANVTTAKLAADAVTNNKLADNSVSTENIQDGDVSTAKIADSGVTTAKIANDAVTTVKIVNDAITSAKIADDAVGSSELGDGVIDTVHIGAAQVTTAKIADSNITTAKITDANVTTAKIANDAITIGKIGCEQTTISDSDSHIPTSGAVVDYVAAQIAPLGGLEVIATEVAFPNTQPASGVVISISDAGGVVVNGSGVSTTGRTVGGSTVTINGFPASLQSKTMAADIGLMVSSTGSSQTYNYHKILAKEADVEQLSNDINDFASRYRVGSSNPTSSLDNGDLFFNTGTGKMLVYNGTNTAWEEVQSIGNFFISTLSPAFDGSTQNFTLTNAPTNVQQVLLSINGVVQKPNAGSSTPSEGFALDGSTIKLASAPASGSDYFVIVMGSTVNIGTPSNNTVSTAVLQDDAVTTAKIAASNVTATELGANAVITSKIADDAVTTAKLALPLDLADSEKIRFGTGNDLEIYHNSTDTAIQNYTGDLYINNTGGNADDIVIKAQDDIFLMPQNGEYGVSVLGDGGVELYHANAKKFSTTSVGATISSSAAARLNITSADNSSAIIRLGPSSDDDAVQIWYDDYSNALYYRTSTNTPQVWYTNNTQRLVLQNDGHLRPHVDSSYDLGTSSVRWRNLYADTLYGDGSNLTGINTDLVSDTTPQLGGDLDVNGHRINFGHASSTDDRLRFGSNGDDLQIFHGGNGQFDCNTGNIEIRHTGDFSSTRNIHIRARVDRNSINCFSDGSVELYHNNSKKLETSSSGISITGGATATGNSAEFRAIESGGATVKIQCGGSEGYIGTHSNHKISFVTNAGSASNAGRRWEISGYGSLIPYDNNTYDIGSSSYRVRNIYTNDLHLSNEGHSNEVDGTWGNWTIQEGESDLFLKNNRSGKKYKFNLTEVA